MEKVLIIYFSGMGNTKLLANMAKDEFNAKGYDTKVVDVCSDEVVEINDYNYLVVAYPIYAFNAPGPIISFIKKFNKINNDIKCLILKDSGEYLFWNNASSLQLTSILKKKGIKIFSEYHYLLPYSFVFRHTDYMAYKMLYTLKYLLPLDIDDFLGGKYHKLDRFFLDRPFSFVFRIQRFGGRLNGRFYKVDQDKCIKCNKCINNCPANNIKIKDDKYIFGGKCLMCQRCVVNCPHTAIKAGFFKRWMVGGAYSFKETTEFEVEKKPKYCAKSYKKYFEESVKRGNKIV